jgi:hypothetical protein
VIDTGQAVTITRQNMAAGLPKRDLPSEMCLTDGIRKDLPHLEESFGDNGYGAASTENSQVHQQYCR